MFGRKDHPRAGLRRALVGVLLATTALGHMAGEPVRAQEAQSARAFNVPAQPLGEALALFGRQSGLQITAAAEVIGGRTSHPLDGAYGAAEALSHLLTGTGLTFRFIGENTVRIEPAPEASNGATQLGPVRVGASADDGSGRPGDPAVTEGTRSYTTRAATTATRLPLSPRETPQTVTIVTRQQMDDFALTDVDAILSSTSGTYVFDRGSNGSEYYSRGFTMQTQYDGLPNPIGISQSNRVPSPDSAFLDRVEVQQGAAGLLNGAGEPGGTINMVRKRPTDVFQASVEAQGGSWNRVRTVGDISTPFVKSGAVRGRVVALWDRADSFVDYAEYEKHAFYGIIEADVTKTTTLSASIQYQHNDGISSQGVPMGPLGQDLGFRRSTFFGDARGSSMKKYAFYTVGIEQKLPADWFVKGAYAYVANDVRESRGSFLEGTLDVSTGDGLKLARYWLLEREFRSETFDVYASGPFSLFGRRHELVIGATSVTMKDASRNSGVNRGADTAINIYDFDPTTLVEAPGVWAPLPDKARTRQQGVYGVARLNIADPLKLIVGARVSWYDYRNAAGVTTFDQNGVVSPYGGVILDVNSWLSAYVSYSDIFRAQSQKDRTGNILDPVEGTNYEAGLKGEFLGGRLNAAAAVYRLEQTNLPRQDVEFGNDPSNPCAGWCYIAEDKVTSQGVDLSVNGEIVPGWNLSAGYTYVDSKYASGVNKGRPYRAGIPEHVWTLSTTYRFPDSGWTVGGGLRAQSRFYMTGVSGGVPYRAEQGGYVVVNLMARYRITEKAEVSVNVDNLFDKKYYSSLENLNYVQYGEPRRFMVNARYVF